MKPSLPPLPYAMRHLPGDRRPRIEPPQKLLAYLASIGIEGANLRDSLKVWDSACSWVRARVPAARDADVVPIAMLYFRSLDTFQDGPMEREAMKFAACELIEMMLGVCAR